ncbi:MAG: sialyltransferase, partial [Candidatus Heimdallarchaeaceae archaeon]
IFAFGDYWIETVTYPIGKNRIFSVGFPELETSRQKYARTKKKNQIVFISQPWIGTHLSKLAIELNKVENLGYKVIYKLHPNEVNTWKEEFPWLLNSGIEVIDHEGKGLYELFAESEIQIGVNSTALFEGLFFGVKTLLFDYFGIDYMEDLLKSKVAEKFSDADDLVKKIKKIKTIEFDADYFFRSNSLKNIATRIKKMMEGKN